jgi:predicted nucleotidyltransferase
VNERYRVIYQVVAGSRAHGLATEESDTDSRGVCIPPPEVLLGLGEFEQHESPDHDHVIYSLAKFARLALEGNPNIIETLFTDDEHVLECDALGEELRRHRESFLSRRVGERFMGYALGQLKRIERHRRWLADPPSKKPEPADFGATPHDGRHRFPDADQERAYRGALKHHRDYESWRAKRNPVRAALEESYGYDTKHAMHLCRLLKMGREILAEGEVRVRRPDREWLLGVRRGAMPYEELVDWAEAEVDALPGLVTASALPEEPDRAGVDALVVRLHRRAIDEAG